MIASRISVTYCFEVRDYSALQKSTTCWPMRIAIDRTCLAVGIILVNISCAHHVNERLICSVDTSGKFVVGGKGGDCRGIRCNGDTPFSRRTQLVSRLAFEERRLLTTQQPQSQLNTEIQKVCILFSNVVCSIYLEECTAIDADRSSHVQA